MLSFPHEALAVFSAMAHGKRAAADTSAQIATAAIVASLGLDPDRATLYVDLVLNSITEAARQALQAMIPANYEYQSAFARHYFFGGKVELLIKQAKAKFGQISEDAERYIRESVSVALDRMGERLLTAASIDEVSMRAECWTSTRLRRQLTEYRKPKTLLVSNIQAKLPGVMFSWREQKAGPKARQSC